MTETPDIMPEYWEDAAALMALRIDNARERGLQHPNTKQGYMGLLKAMRDEYDGFLERVWELDDDEWDGLLMANWFTAYATLALDLSDQHPEIYLDEAIDTLELMIGKQHDYGHNNISRFGMRGILVRLHDKLSRLENLGMREYEMDTQAINESTEDSVYDIVGYCIIACMFSLDLWLLPLSIDC